MEVAGGGAHQVRFDCLGGASGPVTLALYVNGYKLAQVQDDDGLPPGYVAVSGQLGASATMERSSVVFDDFTVTRQR